MSNSTRYFQLTPDILIEYRYSDIDVITNQGGDQRDHIFDLLNVDSNLNKGEHGYVIKSNYDGSRNFYFEIDKDGLVLPMNTSESRFVQYDESSSNSYTNIDIEGLTNDCCDVVYDNIRIHFTGGLYFGEYDGLILRSYIYDKMKNKICLFSHCIRKTDNVKINKDPMLINQKLYTTYLDFRMPSPNALINSYDNNFPLKKSLSYGYSFMADSPLVFNIYGIKSTYKDILDRDEKYVTEKLNSIYIPIVDSYNNVNLSIEEASDGDYFKIKTGISDEGVSFSDFIYNLSNGHPEIYIILHELTLTEYYTPIGGNDVISKVTHREHYIANGGEDGVLNEEALEHIMIYRPVVMSGGKTISFIIEDQLKIINTYDNTTILKTASYECKNPKKYGKKMNKIYLGNIPAQVNVYNKRPDEDLDTVKITNSSSNVKIENHQHSITSFIECINVGVSIEQIPTSTIEMQ